MARSNFLSTLQGLDKHGLNLGNIKLKQKKCDWQQTLLRDQPHQQAKDLYLEIDFLGKEKVLFLRKNFKQSFGQILLIK